MIDRATIDKIMDATNIVDVVGDFVTLRKAGVNYKGLCPFHDDTTPSFMVSPSKQICHCFACGEGGNAVNFLMKHEQLSYPDALRWLAKKYNIEIQEKELTDEEKREQSERDSMFIVNDWAMHYFQRMLKEDPSGIAIGKQYFRSRGIRDDVMEKFLLGYALPERQALYNTARKEGFQEAFLTKTGLCIQNERGIYDRYAGRVIFPWLNVSGRVVAFGGRLLDSRTKGVAQKYVNSPDSEIYHKERELYGLFQAKRAIAKEDLVYMVEGYTDVIAMHQCGLENVVANSGTALSLHQIKLLRRFTQNITLLYDSDEAGVHAVMRGTDMLLAEGMNLKVLLLPDGDDPDSFSRKHTAQEFRDYIKEHQTDFMSFMIRRTVEQTTDPVKRSEAISAIVKSISVVPDPILRSTYLSELSMRLGIKEQTLLNSMNNFIRKDIEEKTKERNRSADKAESGEQTEATEAAKPTEQQETAPAQPFIGLHTIDEHLQQLEQLLVQCIVRHGEEVIYKDIETDDGGTTSLTVAQYISMDLGADNLRFHDERLNQILQEATDHSGQPDFKAETYFTQHPDFEISSLATNLIIERHQLGARFQPKVREDSLQHQVEHLVLDYRLELMETHLKEIKRALRDAGNKMDVALPLLEQFTEAKLLRDALARQLGNDLAT